MGLGWFLLVLATLATLLSGPGTGAFAPCSNASRALGCGDPHWIVPDGALKCSTFGSDPCASELVASGSSACAYQEMRVVPNLPCQISGGLYALATCVGTCTPLVVVCSGKYMGKLHHPAPVVASVSPSCDLQTTSTVGEAGWLLAASSLVRSLVHCAGIGHDSGRCLFGVVPSAVNEWASFDATFTPSVDVITVYIWKTGTDSSVVNNLTVQQLIGTPQSHRSRSSMRCCIPLWPFATKRLPERRLRVSA